MVIDFLLGAGLPAALVGDCTAANLMGAMSLLSFHTMSHASDISNAQKRLREGTTGNTGSSAHVNSASKRLASNFHAI